MNKINNLEQLNAEISRLREISKKQEAQLKSSLKELKEDLKPENIILNGLSSISGIRFNDKNFWKDGIMYGISMLIQKFVFKTEKKIEGRIYDFLDRIFDKIKSFTGKHTSQDAKREQRREEREKEDA
jgi:hypothetical protein